MFELQDDDMPGAVIKVVGVGGGGGNAVAHMLVADLNAVEFICANTDAQALSSVQAHKTIQLGRETTKGLGAGADPEIGRAAAIEDRDAIGEAIAGSDMIFITAGMGGGTGTGAAPIVAEVAKGMGILTVAVVTTPFPFEGRKRMLLAEKGLQELREQVDSLIIIPNEKLMKVLGRSTSLIKAFAAANDVLLGAVRGIAELITCPGMINVDFADVRTVMSEMGMAMMGSDKARGEDRASVAAEGAINSPLLENVDLKGASGILVNITAGLDLTLGEFSEVGNIIEKYASNDATIVIGTVIDTELVDDLKVTVVATGFEKKQPQVEALTEKTVAVKKPVAKSYTPNMDQIELPTVLRRKQQQALLDGKAAPVPKAKTKTEDMFDVPTFLRRRSE
ncbi:MAG: cell division protein FtsZ [Pseudomonadales bacterium]|nr:cell division protein FtsZ [Pseudomonadales bacterium]NRA16362.1 cell division protein FtsZ [Oceanospirillaceae bacterium]